MTMNRELTIRSQLRTYTVEFSEGAVELIRKVFREGDILCVDRVVADIYPEVLQSMPNSVFLVEPTEEAKSYEGVMPLLERLISVGFKRDNRLLAVGGGITQDVVSFVASLIYRGVDWIFFPTTLLAQCDSCIGSKTSINFRQYKNQLGGFYPPAAVYIDTQFIKSLGRAELSSGLGEMLHYFLVTSEADFTLFMLHASEVKEGGSGLNLLVQRSLLIKKAMIEIDEFDRGPRNIFNYGHSFGHALEASCGYALPHGIAVSYGIDLANLVAMRLGILDEATRNRIRQGCWIVFDGVSVPELDVEQYYRALTRDKKNSGGKLGLILLSDIGQAKKYFVEFTDDLKALIKSFFYDRLYLRDL